MRYKRVLRYLAPNLFTAANIIFGLMALVACFDGRYVDSSWWIIYAVLTDRLDGFVARAVRGTSELGVQLDSFADMLNFGVAPALLIYTSLSREPQLPFAAGAGRAVLMIACACWVLAAVFRLARYNITTDDQATKIFFGVPTTMVGGLLVIWFLALLKYTGTGDPLATETFGGMALFGELETPPEVWRYFPVVMFLGAFAMASTLRMPKLGLADSRAANIFIFANVFLGYGFGFARWFPEYMVWPPTAWLFGFLAWGALSPAARRMKPPPLFPETDPPQGKEPMRPEDDMLPDHIDTTLDHPEQAEAAADDAGASTTPKA